jgi:hypothetical protein
MKKFRDCTTIELLVENAVRDYHDPDLIEEICDRAGLADAYAASHGDSSADGGETFESVLDRALEILEDKEGL